MVRSTGHWEFTRILSSTISADAANPGVLYFARNGVNKTTDYGTSTTPVNQGIPQVPIIGEIEEIRNDPFDEWH